MSTTLAEQTKPDQQVRRETSWRVIFLGFCAVVMLAYFIIGIFEEPLEADNFTNGYSTSPAGHSALIELLRANRRTVKPGHTSLHLPEYKYRATDTLALLQPGPEFVDEFEEEFKNLFAGARETESSVLLVLPKRTYEEADEQPGDELVLWEDLHAVSTVNGVLGRTGFDRWLAVERLEGDGRKLIWHDGQAETTLSGPTQVFRVVQGTLGENFEVLAADQSGAPMVVRYRVNTYSDGGGVLLVSDPDIFTNRYIDSPGAATLVFRVFGETPNGGTILVDEDLHGFSTDASLEYLAATPPGLWVTLSVLVLLAVFGWRQATVLRPRTAEPLERRERKFSIEGLARMMERAGEHHKAYRRLLWRSRLVLGTGGAQVHAAGKSGRQSIKKGKTGRITRIEGDTSEQQLINAARKVAHQKRTGETEHSDWD